MRSERDSDPLDAAIGGRGAAALRAGGALLDLILTAGIPRPRLNAPAAGFEVDALWREERALSWTNRLQVGGYLVLRFMHGDLVRRLAAVAAAISRAMASRT